MPENHDIEAALKYHNATKHSYASVRANPHFLDFANQPIPFKIYPTLEPSRLPDEMRQTGVAALSAIAESVPAQTNAAPDLKCNRPTPLSFRRHNPAEKVFGRRNIFSRGGLYRSALRGRALSGLRRTRRSSGWRLSLRPCRVRPAQVACRRLSQRAGRSHGW